MPFFGEKNRLTQWITALYGKGFSSSIFSLHPFFFIFVGELTRKPTCFNFQYYPMLLWKNNLWTSFHRFRLERAFTNTKISFYIVTLPSMSSGTRSGQITPKLLTSSVRVPFQRKSTACKHGNVDLHATFLHFADIWRQNCPLGDPQYTMWVE